MDPLSVTTGVIAVVGAVEQAAKCIQKLRAIRQAPREVSLLLEEVADLREVLQQVETAQRPPEYRERAVPFDEEKPAKGLDRLIRRTSAKLEELDSLLQHHGKTANRIESAIDKFNADNAEQVKATKVLTSLVRSVGVELPSSDSSDIKIDRSRTVSWVSSLWRHGLDGNIPAIQDLFSRGLASPNDVQGLGGSVLHYAADHGHWHLCKFLIGEGARLDDEDDFHNTPTSLAWEKILSGALTENEASMVASMFANTDFLQTRQFSVLHKIVLHLIPRTIESELDYTTRDLNAVDSSGRTALVWAAARGDELALRTLINYGADVNLPDGQGNTPLHHARTVECIDKLLHAGADTLARNTFGQTPLHMVCRGTGSLPVLKRLMTADIDIDATDNSGETVLHNATFNKHVECAFHLVHSGADINIANNAKDAPIHMALMSDVPATLLLLLNHGAEYQQATHNGRTILHYAAGLVCAETVDILKNHGLPGIDVDARDLDGKTVEDILEERADDDDDPLFKSRFRDMLDSVRNAQGAKQTVIPDLPELTMEIKGSLGVIKDNPVVHVTPVSSDEDEDEDVHDYENDTHGAPVFFDAVEEIQQGVQVIEIAA
ncbi:MAG: hypothetical protein Q9200_001647 [Gallowayella weberi]